MKCGKCGYVYVGNFCPKCGEKAVSEYTERLRSPINSVYKASTADNNKKEIVRDNKLIEKNTQNYNPYQNDDSFESPKTPVYYPPAQYSEPKKKEMSVGKIVAIVLSIVFGALILLYALPFGMFFLFDGIDTARNNMIKSQDDSTVHIASDKVEIGDFVYSLTDIKFNDTYKEEKAGKDYEFLIADVNIKNISDDREYIDAEISCYADNYLYIEYSGIDFNRELNSGMTEVATLVFKIPKDRNKLVIDFSVSDEWSTDRSLKFNIE